MQFRFALDTKASPDQVLAAFTDFTDRRPAIWKETLDARWYELHELGDTWAVAREGSASPSVWAVERYDWSDAGKVSWAAQESNFCKPGSGVDVIITPKQGGGSHLEGRWHKAPAGAKGALVVPLARLLLPKTLPKQWAQALDRYADGDGRSGSTS